MQNAGIWPCAGRGVPFSGILPFAFYLLHSFLGGFGGAFWQSCGGLNAGRAERASYDHVSQFMRCLEEHLQLRVEKAGRPIIHSPKALRTSSDSLRH
jgi:hypothetical protein